MKSINVQQITEKVEELCIRANCYLNQDIEDALYNSLQAEESPQGREVLASLLENADIARKENIPICQDTGMMVLFVEIGQDVHIIGGSLTEALNEGVRRGYTKGYLRKSVVRDPFARENTGDNTPAVIHYEIVSGDQLSITAVPKGFGSENMGGLKMLKPSEGLEGAKDFIIETVENAGANPCPPIIVGVGIGGTMEKAALLAKKALLRPVGENHPEQCYADMEKELLQCINNLGIGPQGYGGITTALAVNIETYPTHIAGLPVAVNINCHVARHLKETLEGEDS